MMPRKGWIWPNTGMDRLTRPWTRKVEQGVDDIHADLDRLRTSMASDKKAQTAAFTRLGRSITDLQAANEVLLAMQARAYAEFTTSITGFTGYYNGALPSVDITSPTGRIEVSYGGSLNGGDGYFLYAITRLDTSATVVARTTIQGNPARRVAVSGGASFAPSGFFTAQVDVPRNVPLRIALHLNTGSSFTFFFGGSIAARVVA
jgi:hypothetical protein